MAQLPKKPRKCRTKIKPGLFHLFMQSLTHFALSVVAGDCQGSSVSQHLTPWHADAEHTSILLGCVLHVSWGVVSQPRRRQPILGGFGQTLSHKPLQFGPPCKQNMLQTCLPFTKCYFSCWPLNSTTSPDAVCLGSPLKQASEVRASVTPQLPSRNPICCDPASLRVMGTSMGTGTAPAMTHP